MARLLHLLIALVPAGIIAHILLSPAKAEAAPPSATDDPKTPGKGGGYPPSDQPAADRPGAPSAPGTGIYETPPEAAIIHPCGWVDWTLPNGRVIKVTCLPLLDVRTGLFARLRYRFAAIVAKREGAQLMSEEIADDLAARGFRLKPCILPPTSAMASKEWAEKHDACVKAQLERWDGRSATANIGKHWLRGAAPGRALNYGWHDSAAPNGRMWQSRGTRHDDMHTDYSQLTYLVKE